MEVESGVIGGFFVGIGLVIVWRLKRIWMAIVLATLAGGLGGLVFALEGNARANSDISSARIGLAEPLMNE